MMTPPDQTALQHLKLATISRLLKPEAEMAKQFVGIVNALKKLSYHVSFMTTSQAEQKEIFLQRAKTEFDFEQKQLFPNSVRKRAVFDKKKVRYPQELTHKKYKETPFFYGWTIVFPQAVKMFQKGLLRKVSYVDGAHANADQVQVGVVAKDANNKLVVIALVASTTPRNSGRPLSSMKPSSNTSPS